MWGDFPISPDGSFRHYLPVDANRVEMVEAPRALAVAALAVSPFPVVYLHLSSGGTISPVQNTISDYVSVSGGTWLLGFTALALAVGSIALLVGMVRSGLPRRGPVAVLIGLWAAGLAVVAVFPTDPVGAPTSVTGLVHRYAGAVMFASLPIAGWLVSRAFLPSPLLRRLSILAGFASGAFMLSHTAVLGAGSGLVLLGLFERVLFVVLYALLFTLAAALSRREGTS
ncbi:hypothetical protein GCM10010428_68530 [Actinosynnema pretiosum subsp. pretiosum]